MMRNIRNVQIRITGRVQGVGFRYYAVKKASEMRILGFVKNMYDDSVFIEAEGEESDLDSYILWCRKGPASARVDNLDITPGVVKNYYDFSVRH
jgi:acylphosphatase